MMHDERVQRVVEHKYVDKILYDESQINNNNMINNTAKKYSKMPMLITLLNIFEKIETTNKSQNYIKLTVY